MSADEEWDDLVYAARSHRPAPLIVQRVDQLDAVIGAARAETLAQSGALVTFGQPGTSPAAADE